MQSHKDTIVAWLKDYMVQSGMHSFVVGVSGGVDSAVVSTLCALTGRPTYLVSMPIKQEVMQNLRAQEHITWLCRNHANTESLVINLTSTFEQFEYQVLKQLGKDFDNTLAFANSRSRLRMIALYQIAQSKNGLVVGTGNRVEDFGVGFYTKYGDGGVDISPIADLYKTEVRQLAAELGVSQDIVTAAPTDGLWDDGRTDEDQLGATYAELEAVMKGVPPSTEREHEVYAIFNKHHQRNRHKMVPIPICKIER